MIDLPGKNYRTSGGWQDADIAGIAPARVRTRTVCRAIAAMLVLIGLLSCSGCIWLAIPSLAYEGYRYEKTGSLTGTPASSHPASRKSQSRDSG